MFKHYDVKHPNVQARLKAYVSLSSLQETFVLTDSKTDEILKWHHHLPIVLSLYCQIPQSPHCILGNLSMSWMRVQVTLR